MNARNFPLLRGGQALRVNRVPLDHEPVPPNQAATTAAATTTATVPLGTLAGTAFGIWELGVGSMQDMEAEEVFVVLAGHGTVVIEPFEGHPARTADLAPGTVMRLSAGMKTTWTVTEPLRKVYFTLEEDSRATE
ncbi:cupin domain-containing protein [Paeniglutamicibacter sp. ZC-3]|uniref:cupin domain-containing protein n=1 Tax=Paeniglutamicibacter sp. ZC-3 TaxID=2986919 RepID=UPI0021F79E37|nr:cupin domain-containing protein [Paeniglutamicibacter sp. ZC-3]MCV9994706.1 cupin domain-containing protein [Paeniglutamicibacter sp. ZC-3]